MDELSDLELTLWRFRMAGHEATVVTRGFNKVPDLSQLPVELLFGITNHALLVVVKFVEVWDAFGSLAKVDTRVVQARRALQPLVSRIQVWSGFDQHRNTTLAHAYLDKQGRPVPPWLAARELKAPTFHAESILLLQCVVLANLSLSLLFAPEYRRTNSVATDSDD